MEQQNESVERLEGGKDYINLKDGSIIVIDKKIDYGNNGFIGKLFKHALVCFVPNSWREATEEEVIEAFKKHLVHRCGGDWETMKIKEKHPYSILGISDSSWSVEISKSSKGWDVWNENALLYRDGIWVERLEEKKIHIKDAIKERTVIHCETIEEADRILKMAIELGYTWNTGRGYRGAYQWGINESRTCYCLFHGSYSGYNYFKKNDYTIIPSTQIADLEEKKSNKKRYEVIKTTFSDFKQLSLGDNKTNKIVAHFVEQDEETALLAEKIVDILNLINK